MLITIKKTHTVEESIELKLPAFFRSYNDHYMIQENETLITVYCTEGYLNVSVFRKDLHLHKDNLSIALKGAVIEPEVFYQVWDKAIQHLEQEVLKPQL